MGGRVKGNGNRSLLNKTMAALHVREVNKQDMFVNTYDTDRYVA